MKLLIIDDDPAVREACVRIFGETGYEVTAASRGEEGLTFVEQGEFDVILCDWKMPGLDGMDVVRELDLRSPESAVVMISGFPSTERVTQAMARGALEYVAKPFTPQEITQAVDRALRRHRELETRSLDRAASQFSPDDRSPSHVAETVANKIGVGKVAASWRSALVLGFLGGAYIAFGGVLATSVTFDLAARMGIGFTRLVAGSVFSLGLMLVVIAGAELFTGNNLMISSVMTGGIRLGKMLERWVVIYLANFLGAVTLALLFALSGLWKTGGGALGGAALTTAWTRVNFTFLEALLRGVGCNWLVCLAVWMALASRQTIGKIFAILFPIMAFVAIGFEHCVANMYFIPAALFLQDIVHVPTPEGVGIITWGAFLWKNLLPVTIGNIIGGVVFVGMSYWSAFLGTAKRA